MKRINLLIMLGFLWGCGDLVEVDGPLGPILSGSDLDLGSAEDAAADTSTGFDSDLPDLPVSADMETDMVIIDPGPIPNEGWIGGACTSATQCDFDDALCDTTKPGGQCTLACERTCPDRDGNNTVTFCITDGGAGRCVSRCDYNLFPNGGCRSGYECKIRERHNEPGTQQAVCVPEGEPNPNATTACLRELDELGVLWSPWNYTTQYADGLACTINDPIRVASPINDIEYRYYNQTTAGTMSMACDLALALHKLGNVLKEYNMKSVLHIGTFNCRKISGSSNLSQHSFGNAIDIWGFESQTNERFILEEHWQHDTTNFTTEKARVLYEIGQRMHTDRIFNIVLTPNYNAAHDNHFHVDLTSGGNFIGSHAWPEYYIGSDRWDLCPHD